MHDCDLIHLWIQPRFFSLPLAVSAVACAIWVVLVALSVLFIVGPWLWGPCRSELWCLLKVWLPSPAHPNCEAFGREW